MNHPCSKECIRYALCIGKKEVNCALLRKYYMSLLQRIYITVETLDVDDDEHKAMWEKIHTKLPNINKIPPCSDESMKLRYEDDGKIYVESERGDEPNH